MRFVSVAMTILLGVTITYGQTKDIRGLVLDKEDNSPIAGVIVQVVDSAGTTYQYAITNDKGEYYIKCNSSEAERLRFQCMGYSPREMTIPGKQSPLNIYMTAQPTQLRDVIIKSPDIEQRSDTLTYYMSKYATAEDKKLADVLKRLPGIKVEDNGQIKYNGEPINKFYIDGSDFMDGRYGIATENINPADVVSVDVLENHQPMQVLKGLEFSQQAGLNIKLKEEARHKWIAILNSGIGMSPTLYDASAFAMRITGKWQNMESLRVNNTGWNPASQSQQQISNEIFGNSYADTFWNDYIDVGISVSPIDVSRTRDNFSILANSSNSWHIGNGKDMKLIFTYENDRLDYMTGYETNYFDDNIPSFTEYNSMRTQAHRVNGQWALQINRPKMFLKNNLYVDADWNDAVSNIGGTLTLFQKTETPSFNATNDLQLVKRIDSNLITLSSRNKYTHKPHSLWIEESAVQDITSDDLRSVTEVRYGKTLGRWKAYARGGIDFNYHDMSSQLYGFEMPFSMRNDMRFFLLNTFLSPEISYDSYKWRIKLSAPTSYNLHSIKNMIAGDKITNNYVAVNPSLYVRHSINAKMEISTSLRYSLTPPQAEMFITDAILTDYRNIYLSEPTTAYKNSCSATMNFKYRNPITSLFLNMTGKYEWNSIPYMQNQLFADNYIINTYSPTRYDGNNLSINGSISKGLGRLTISMDVAYARVETSTMRQTEISPYIVSILSVQPAIKGYFVNWLSTDYRLVYSRNAMNIGTKETSDYNVLKQYLTLTFIPARKWQIAIGGEHYYTKFSSGSSANLLLLDSSIRWNLSKNTDITLMATNLLNRREYRYASYGMLSETEFTYRLRGQSIMASIQIRI